MNKILRLAEIGVAGTLLYSGLHHAINPYQFASATAAYNLLPTLFLYILPFVLASLMIVLGVSLISDISLDAARVIAMVVLMSFTAAQCISYAYDMQISCGCFGLTNDPISIQSISVPAVCATVCLLNWIFQKRKPDEAKLKAASVTPAV